MELILIVVLSIVVVVLLALLYRRHASLRTNEPQLVRVELGEDKIRQMLQGERDFRLCVDLDGTVSARCKSCNAAIQTAEQGEILWFRCPSCKRVSLCLTGNIARDRQLAIKDGEPFEYELFYMQDLPPELKPPF